MPDIFTYEIHKGDLISRWMLSPLKEEHYRSRPEPYPSSYGVNMPWREAVSPVRVQYVEEKPFEREEVEFLPCGEVYLPFETEKVERSAFWPSRIGRLPEFALLSRTPVSKVEFGPPRGVKVA